MRKILILGVVFAAFILSGCGPETLARSNILDPLSTNVSKHTVEIKATPSAGNITKSAGNFLSIQCSIDSGLTPRNVSLPVGGNSCVFDNVPAGTHTITISADYHATKVISVSVANNDIFQTAVLDDNILWQDKFNGGSWNSSLEWDNTLSDGTTTFGLATDYFTSGPSSFQVGRPASTNVSLKRAFPSANSVKILFSFYANNILDPSEVAVRLIANDITETNYVKFASPTTVQMEICTNASGGGNTASGTITAGIQYYCALVADNDTNKLQFYYAASSFGPSLPLLNNPPNIWPGVKQGYKGVKFFMGGSALGNNYRIDDVVVIAK